MKQIWKDLRADYRYIGWLAIFCLLTGLLLDAQRWYSFVAANYSIAVGMGFITILTIVACLFYRHFSKLPKNREVFPERGGECCAVEAHQM